MKNLLLFFAVISLVCSSCKKDGNLVLNGVYNEVTPSAGGMQLNFVGNLVIKTDKSSSYNDSFYYAITNGNISLTPYWSNIYPASNFQFQLISINEFNIQNLNASIPEAPISFMSFKKQ